MSLIYFTKRILVLVLLLVMFPLIVLLVLLIIIVSGFPVFFIQERVGVNGKVFKMYKFRTMYKGAEKERKKYQKLNEADGPVFKIKDDPRFTRIGKFLCHTGLDELPQLLNILKGDMNFIGPRPLPVYEERLIPKKYRYKRQSVKPGIISAWVVNGYHRMDFKSWMENDMDYILNWSFPRDIKLFVSGVKLIIKLFAKELSGSKFSW